MNPLTAAAAGLITLYQRFVSPHKGFVCAHRALHHGPSCSAYVKNSLLSEGLWHTLTRLPARARACGAAARLLAARRNRPDDLEQDRRKRKRLERCCSGMDGVGDVAEAACCLFKWLT